jgi:Asp-tRNA(Asn)/Glu-tRNA(Gln) amidotransferase A subunit family amidase
MKRLVPVVMLPLTVWVLSAATAARAGAPPGRNGRDDGDGPRHLKVLEATTPEMQAALRSHAITSKKLVKLYLERIAAYEGTLNAYIRLNPDAMEEAKSLDRERAGGHFDALLFPSSRGADIAARPGYPSVTVPFGLVPNAPTPPFPDGFNALPGPYGITFTGQACSEPTLIRLAYALEQATQKRVAPASVPPLSRHGG